MKNLTRGSEWHRWELHMHTPETKKNDQYIGTTAEEKWSIFYQNIKDYVGDGNNIETNISAFAVTDYLSIENYQKIRKDNCLPESIKLIMPNVELRFYPLAKNSPINMHCIFSPLIVDELETRFFNKLKFKSQREYTANKVDLMALGREFSDTKIDDATAYVRGIEQFVIQLDDLIAIFNGDPELREKTILVVSNSSSDGVSGLMSHKDWINEDGKSQLTATRMEFYRQTDAIFSGNPNDRKYFAGLGSDKVVDIIKKYGTLKPCYHGSDAHTNEKIFNPDNEKYCWIKADLTFEGLKQTLNEPIERVYIGKTPEILHRIDENQTKYITSVYINKKTEYKGIDDEWFDNIEIPLNPGLVAIIGNKGSGKSAIADIIALNADSKHQADYSFLHKDKFKKKGCAERFYSHMMFKSGKQTDDRSLNYDIADTSVPLVQYLPQNYFETVCNEIGNITNLRNEIEKVVFQYIPLEKRLGKSSFNELVQFKTASINNIITNEISEIEKVNEKIIAVENSLDPKNKQRLENELAVKKEELQSHMRNIPPQVSKPQDSDNTKQAREDLLSKKNDKDKLIKDTEAKVQEISELNGNIEYFKQIITEINLLANSVKNIKDKYQEKLSVIGINFDTLLDFKFNQDVLNKQIKSFEDHIDNLQKTIGVDKSDVDYVNSNNAKIEQIDNIISKKEEQLSQPEKVYQDYLRAYDVWEKRKSEIIGDVNTVNTTTYLENEISKIDTILPNELLEYRKQRLEHAKKIYQAKESIKQIYDDIKSGVSSVLQEENEQDFTIESSFGFSTSFIVDFLLHINKRVIGSFRGEDDAKKLIREKLLDELDIDSEESVCNFLTCIIDLLEKDYSTKEDRFIGNQVNNREAFYKYIFSLEYILPHYELKLNGKQLNELSPGEKGGLLLVFYLILDKNDCPLIIDQPEDNLDNNSVAKVLVPYILRAKQRRQIIMVTHNPNLAVVADAEQIIAVSIDKANKNIFSFVSGGIENENINEAIVDVLEGTMLAFEKRESKYYHDLN